MVPMFSLLAQSGSGGEEAAAAAIGIGIIIIALIAAVIGLAIAIFILYLLYSVLARVPEPYRKMAPGMVFLLLIPLFNIVWIFFTVLNVSGSLKNYFDSVGRTDVGDCGKAIGLGWAICVVAGIIPIVNFIASPAALILMIIYLVKVNGLKNQIQPTQAAPAM